MTQQINVLPKEEFLKAVSGFMDEFLDRSIDQSVEDNIRWAIASKIIARILETCPQERLVDIFVKLNSRLLGTLEAPFSAFEGEQIGFFNLVREKSHVMAFYEILYRRLAVQMIKTDVHGQLYPDDAAQNKLTKRLVEIAAEGKRAPIPNFAAICKDASREAGGDPVEGANFRPELPEINSQHAVQNYYSCVAYSLLSSVIVCTQEKSEMAYANFLFQAQQGDAEHSMWSLLIDTTKEYEFKV